MDVTAILQNVTYGATGKFLLEPIISCLMVCDILLTPNFLTFQKSLAEEGGTSNSKALCLTSKRKHFFSLIKSIHV